MERRDLIALVWAAGLSAGNLRAQSGRGSAPHAVLFGTVFNESHLALQGARIVAFDQARPKKKYRSVTNHRGEYHIRVPAGDATFVVSATAPKFARAERTVRVWGVDKSTANLILGRRGKSR